MWTDQGQRLAGKVRGGEGKMLRMTQIRLLGAGKGMMISNSGHTRCYQCPYVLFF